MFGMQKLKENAQIQRKTVFLGFMIVIGNESFLLKE